MNVLDALINHFGTANVVGRSGRRVKVRCPLHGGGVERTPSCVVNIAEPYLGHFTCMACGEHGDLSKLIGGEYEQDFSLHLDKSILKEDVNPVNPAWQNWPRWPKEKTWRTIPGWLVRDISGRVETTEFGKRLALPVLQHGKCQGLIHCALKKSKLAYIYDNHPFIKSSLFGFDYTKRLLKKSRTKTLFFVEGPRDTARFLAFGLPTVGNMGGITVWTQNKWGLIEELNPKLLVVATDPDTIGDKTAQAVREAAYGSMEVKRLNFKITYDAYGKVCEKQDPGNYPELKIMRLAEKYS